MKGYTKLEEQTGIEFKHIRLLVQVSVTHNYLLYCIYYHKIIVTI
jgi:hypothetical protein